jgi:hypothetical protein
MKKTETREETLARLARDASEGPAAAKRFESLVRRMIKTPPQPRKTATKSRG